MKIPPPKKRLKRGANLLYGLRKKGVRCNTRERTVFYPYGQIPGESQIQKLRDEFNFNIQFTF
jgi:hypothetical protein